ncbi:MAG: MipA/OmpV family protein [Kiritimatiellaceae bacterium]|nr:MipA/OmpV family protein [Kiritimatiellaceae bacterium]
MNKLMTVGMAAAMVAGVASAQDGMVITGQAPADNPAETRVTVEAALVSSHVWRGQVLNNDFVFQPQITASQYGVSLNVWGNYDMGKNYIGIQSDTSEIDVSLAYTLPLDINDVAFDVGFVNYNFPANAEAVGNEYGYNRRSTTELFVKATVTTWRQYVIPSVTFFGDIDKVDGTYILFDVVAPYEISDYLFVAGGLSMGWANTRYNDAYWGTSANANGGAIDEGFNDFNAHGSVTYEIMEGLQASLSLQYTMLAGGAVEDGARVRYEAKEKVFGGINIAYDF